MMKKHKFEIVVVSLIVILVCNALYFNALFTSGSDEIVSYDCKPNNETDFAPVSMEHKSLEMLFPEEGGFLIENVLHDDLFEMLAPEPGSRFYSNWNSSKNHLLRLNFNDANTTKFHNYSLTVGNKKFENISVSYEKIFKDIGRLNFFVNEDGDKRIISCCYIYFKSFNLAHGILYTPERVSKYLYPYKHYIRSVLDEDSGNVKVFPVDIVDALRVNYINCIKIVSN